MKNSSNKWRYLLAEPYTWLATVFFGAVMLDIAYFKAGGPLSAENAEMFSAGADLLLLLGALTALAGFLAVGAAWRQRSARALFIVSVVVLLLEFLVPVLLGGLMESVQAAVGVNIGPWVRLIGSGISSILAFLGLWRLSAEG